MAQESYKISILNKIKNKNIILERIFPFLSNRIIILPLLINKDILLKTSLKNIYKSLRKNNGLSEEINDTFFRFKAYRMMQEEFYINQNKLLLNYRLYNPLNIPRLYRYVIEDIFKEKKCDKKYFPENKSLDTYIIDYFQYHKKITLLFPFHANKTVDQDFIDDSYEDSLNLFRNFKEEKISATLICTFGWGRDFAEKIYLKMDKYFIIKNIFCFICQNYGNSFLKKMDILYSYALKGKNKENIKKITFIEYQSNKFFLEFFVNNYIDKIINLNMTSLEEIIINNKKLFICLPKDFNNIKKLNNKEINLLKRRIKDLNILYIDFQNESPYQENFIYFCNNYLSMNIDKIENVFIYNIGEKNYDPNCYYLIKNENLEINCKNLEKIIYEKKIINTDSSQDEESIKAFIDLFFYKKKYYYYSSELLLKNEKTKEMTLQYLSYNISTYDDLVPAYAQNSNMEAKFKLHIKNIIIEFITSNGKVYIKRNKQSPLEFDFNNLEFILKKIISKIGNINSLEVDYFIKSKLKGKMENNLCDSNILNSSQTKIIFKELDSLYEIYYLHKHFKNFQFMKDIQVKYYYKIISDMIKEENLRKKKLIIIKLRIDHIFGIFKDFREKDKSIIFDIKNDKIIYNDINSTKKEINDNAFVEIFLKIKFNQISYESFVEKVESLEIYSLSLIS